MNSHHFLLEDIDGHIDFGEGMNGIYAHGENYQILNQHHGYAQLVTNTYGKGRSIYYVSNVNTEVASFESVGKIAVINNTTEALCTDLYVSGNKVETLNLSPMELRWITI